MITRNDLVEISALVGEDPRKVELDYQMSRVLYEISRRLDYAVFKGGTSLFKCQRLSNRFSEDLDISFSKELSRDERKEVKDTIVEIASCLDMRITNLFNTKIKRDYNCYLLEYKSLIDEMTNVVKIETSMNSISYPAVELEVHSIIGDKMDCDLNFTMKVQTLERTFADKVFAICDYYLTGKTKRYSRHLYDLYKMEKQITYNEELKELIKQVRSDRAKSFVAVSAREGKCISKILTKIVNERYFEEDYLSYAMQYENPAIEYERVIEVITRIAASNLFE